MDRHAHVKLRPIVRLGGLIVLGLATTHAFGVEPAGPPARPSQPRVARLAPPIRSAPHVQPAADVQLRLRPQRSEQLERIAQQADRHTRHGFELAGRKAWFAGRAEFIKALRLIAQGLDAEHQTNAHSDALGIGLTALREAEDFLPRGSRLESDLDLADTIRRHTTPVLKEAAAEQLTPLVALKSYFTFAQQQLALAAGKEVAGSMALHALGKLHAEWSTVGGGNVRAAEPKAVAFFQAALLVLPRNHLAAHELGVLFARSGNLREAQRMLKHSLEIHPQPEGWHNLAVVYRQMGHHELAQRADLLAAQAAAAQRVASEGSANGLVRWVDLQAFAQAQARNPSDSRPPPAREAARPAPPTPAQENNTAKSWWPWPFR